MKAQHMMQIFIICGEGLSFLPKVGLWLKVGGVREKAREREVFVFAFYLNVTLS